MTRFKELRRIERAIEERNKSELEWAQGYARMRVETASMKQHLKSWRKHLNDIEAALEEISE